MISIPIISVFRIRKGESNHLFEPNWPLKRPCAYAAPRLRRRLDSMLPHDWNVRFNSEPLLSANSAPKDRISRRGLLAEIV
jgi:hypothetical protein